MLGMRPTFFFEKKKVGKEKTLPWVIINNRLWITKFYSFSLMKKVVGQLLRYRPHFLWVFEVILSIQQEVARYCLGRRPTFSFKKEKVGKKKTLTGVIIDNPL